jgi:hypothetical protein
MADVQLNIRDCIQKHIARPPKRLVQVPEGRTVFATCPLSEAKIAR